MINLKKYIHFIDNNSVTADNKDIFIKICSAMDIFNNVFQSVMTPSENIAVDDMTIPFKGRSRGKRIRRVSYTAVFLVWVNKKMGI